MSKSSKLRVLNYALVSMVFSGLFTTIALYFMFRELAFSRDFVVFIPAAIVSSAIAVPTCLKYYFRKPEVKIRGAKYGAIIGCLVLFLMSFFGMLLNVILASEDITSSNGFGAFMTSILATVFTSPLMTMVLFLFGGFLAPILGGILGYYLANDKMTPTKR